METIRENPPPYRDMNVIRWVIAYALSVGGNSVYFLALAWAGRQVASPAEVGVLLALGAIPRALLMLFGGVLVDRFGARSSIIVSDATRSLLILVFALAIVTGSPNFLLLAALALLFGVIDAIFMPAVGALPPAIVEPGQLSGVQGMRSVAMRAGNSGGPIIAGFAMSFGGPAAAFVGAGCMFAVSLILLFYVRVRKTVPRQQEHSSGSSSIPRSAWEGLQYIAGHPVLGPLMVVAAISELAFVGPLNIGVVLLAEERGWGGAGVGALLGAFGIGATVSGLLLTALGRVPRAGIFIGSSLLFSALLLALMGYVERIWTVTFLAGGLGLTVGSLSAVIAALIQTSTDVRHIGRTTSVMTLVTLGLAPLTYPFVGAAIDVYGSATVFAACGTVCGMVAVVSFSCRGVREAQLPMQG